MAERRCYHCETRGGFTNKLYEYAVEGMESIYACDACEQRSNWNAVFIKDAGDINMRNIGGGHESGN